MASQHQHSRDSETLHSRETVRELLTHSDNDPLQLIIFCVSVVPTVALGRPFWGCLALGLLGAGLGLRIADFFFSAMGYSFEVWRESLCPLSQVMVSGFAGL